MGGLTSSRFSRVLEIPVLPEDPGLEEGEAFPLWIIQ
jgi:hypothetical protein